jgi:hypothetical protein
MEPAVTDLCYWNMFKTGNACCNYKARTTLLHCSYHKERKKTICTNIYKQQNVF